MAKYTGPCIQCGRMDSVWFARKLCHRCYNKLRESGNFTPRKKYTGPCVICGTYESSSGRFVNKMCNACRSRMSTTGNRKPRRRYEGPCIKCGTYDPGSTGYFNKKMCRNCYRRSVYKKVPPKYCIDCGVEIGLKSHTGRCRSCHGKYRWRNDPTYRKNVKKRVKKYTKTEQGRTLVRMKVRQRRARLAQVENTLTTKQWKAVLAKYNHRCVYCGSKKNLEMDHIIPVSKNGEHTIHNVVPACRSCNSRKCANPPPIPVQPVLL